MLKTTIHLIYCRIWSDINCLFEWKSLLLNRSIISCIPRVYFFLFLFFVFVFAFCFVFVLFCFCCLCVCVFVSLFCFVLVCLFFVLFVCLFVFIFICFVFYVLFLFCLAFVIVSCYSNFPHIIHYIWGILFLFWVSVNAIYKMTSSMQYHVKSYDFLGYENEDSFRVVSLLLFVYLIFRRKWSVAYVFVRHMFSSVICFWVQNFNTCFFSVGHYKQFINNNILLFIN